jgi:uncharacterized membrane protein
MPAPGRCFIGSCAAALAAVLLAAGPARAELALCNRTSFVLEAAIGIEAGGAAATRGWFRLDPGQCRPVLSGEMAVDHLLLHARALPVYGPGAFSQDGHRELCVEEGDFLIAAARACAGKARAARFSEVAPKKAEARSTATLTEEADYALDAARLAGLQRLLALAGYDPGPVDGVPGRRTDQALAQLIGDRKLPADAAQSPAVFAMLVAAVEAAEGRGLTWCNDTRLAVMAALGEDDRGAVVTRGWWRIEPGRCLRPEVELRRTRRVFSFAEAVGPDGAPALEGGRVLAWGGAVQLCTRPSRFELRDHADCAARGLEARGFLAIDLSDQRGRTLRFGGRPTSPGTAARE